MPRGDNHFTRIGGGNKWEEQSIGENPSHFKEMCGEAWKSSVVKDGQQLVSISRKKERRESWKRTSQRSRELVPYSTRA